MDKHPPTPERAYWKKCNVCKKEIGFGAVYHVCSVSTCRGERLGLVFCSVDCWDGHLGDARHRDPWSEEKRAPNIPTPEPQRRIINPTPVSPSSSKKTEVETLVVVSRVKDLIQEQSGFNTSQCAIDALTKAVMRECQNAIENAQVSGRKTVMGRDFRKS